MTRDEPPARRESHSRHGGRRGGTGSRPRGGRGRRVSLFERRAVSDAIAFVLVFSTVIVSVGVVYTFGLQSVTSARDAEQLTNAERTFETLKRNFDDIRRREAPGRSAEMALNGGTLTVRGGSDVSISVTGPGSYATTLSIAALSYRYQDRYVEYENGGVFRRSDDASVMIGQPSIRCADRDDDGTPDYALISVVTLEKPPGSIGGDEVVTITASRESARLLFPTDRDDPGTSVQISFSGPNEAGWNRYLDRSDTWSAVGGGTYQCSAPGGLDQVYVRRTVLSVTIN